MHALLLSDTIITVVDTSGNTHPTPYAVVECSNVLHEPETVFTFKLQGMMLQIMVTLTLVCFLIETIYQIGWQQMEKDYAYVVNQSALLHAAPWVPYHSTEGHLFFDGLTTSFNDLCSCKF
jgi:hypothetical protein